MIRRPPRSTRTDTLFPYTTLFRSQTEGLGGVREWSAAQGIGLAQTRPTFHGMSATHPETYTKPYTVFGLIKLNVSYTDTYGSLATLKIECRKACWFESGQGHHDCRATCIPRRLQTMVYGI